jgi:predicted RNA-binding protein with TRAM domain
MSYRRGGRFGGSRFGGPKPVESGKEYDVQVTEISRKGDGVARIQGFIIFVKGGKVGQKTRIRVTHVGDRFATAETISAKDEQQAQHQLIQRVQDDASLQGNQEQKSELQDYKSSEAEDIKPEEQPPTG